MATTKKKPKRKAAVPSRSIPWPLSAEEYQAIAEKQRADLYVIADKIDRGEPLREWERKAAAVRLRQSAELIRTKQSGRQRSIRPFDVALEFWSMTKDRGMSKNAAYEQLADDWHCSTQAIKNVMKKYGAAALGFFWRPGESN